MEAVAPVGGALLLSAAYAAICVCAGLAVARLVAAPIVAPGAHAFILGQAVLGALWQSLASLGAFSVGAVLLVGLGGVVVAAPLARCWLPLVPARARQARDRIAQLDGWWRAILVLTLSALALYAVLTCSYPGIDADSFYLPQAKIIAASGAFVPLPGYAGFAQIGFVGEMHFAALYLFGGDAIGTLAAKMFVWPTALAIGGVLWTMVGELGGSARAQWAALALVYSSTAVTNIVWDGKSDLFAAAYGIAALHWALRIGRPGQDRATALAGFLGGIAVVAKLSFIVVLPPALALIAVWRLHGSVARLLRHAAAGAASFVAALGVLAFKNALVFGEPLAPFLRLQEGSAGFLEQAWFSPENTRFIVLTYPIALLFGQYPMQHGDLSALWLAVLPLTLLLRREIDRDLLVLTLASIAAVACWAALRPSVLATRYILPPLLGLLPLAAIAAELPWRRASLAWARPAVALGFLGLLAMSQAYDVFFHLRSALADAATVPPFSRNPLWQQAREADRDLAPGGRRLLLQSQRSMLRADLLQCVLLEAELEPIAAAAPSLFERVHAQGGSLILVDRLTHGTRFDAGAAGTPPPWLAVDGIEFGERFMVYRVTPGPEAPKPHRRCEPDGRGGWRLVPAGAAGG